MPYRYWKDEEIGYLKEKYGKLSAISIASHLGRSIGSVLGKACELGLRSSLKPQLRGSENPNWKGGITFKECIQCGKKFRSSSSSKFCSRKCMGAYYKAKYAGAKNPNWRSYVVKKCANCGKEFNVTPYHSNRKFCSQNCCREYFKNHPSIGKALTEKHKRKISLGVKNVWKIKREELLAKISRNPGRLRLLSMRFKENNPSKDSKIKQKIRFARMKQRIPTSLTAPETKFLNIINLCGLPYKYVGNGTFWVGSLNPDFIHVSEKKAIDVFGDYWHRKRKVPWYQTEYGRKEYFRKHGWSLLVIWESQLNSLSEIEVGRMVLEWSNIMESASTIQG